MTCNWLGRTLFKGILLAVGWGSAVPMEALQAPPHSLAMGVPFLRNYGSKEYRAESQNWALAQDHQGLIYAGNGEGVLISNGKKWRLVPTRRRSAVRSLAVDPQGRVYVGGDGEFGYLAWNARGEPEYVPMETQLPADERSFTDIWRICALPSGPCFQSREAIFQFTGGSVRVLKPSTSFHLSFQVGDRLYAQETGHGLSRLEEGRFQALPGTEALARDRVFLVVPWNGGGNGAAVSGTLLIGTHSKGLFLYKGKSLSPFPTEASAYLQENLLYAGGLLADGTLALATLQGSAMVLDRSGHILALLDKRMGLQDQSVNAFLQDGLGGLWVALENGISRIEYPSPLSRFDESSGLQGAVYAVIRHQGVLYAGTNYGVFRLVPGGYSPGQKGVPFREAAFQSIPGIKSQTWDFLPLEETLLVANQHGVYELRENHPTLIRSSARHTMSIYRSGVDPSRVFIGLQDGLVSLRRSGQGRWTDEGRVPGVTEQIRSMYEDPEGRLWLGTRSQGFLRVTFHGTGGGGSTALPEIERFGMDQGLPSLNHNMVHPSRNGPLFTTHQGFFRFDEADRRFVADSRFAALFPRGPRWVFRTREDSGGRLWMHSVDETTGNRETGAALPQPDGTYRWDTTPLRRIGDAAIEPVFPDTDGVVWLGGPDGLFRLDPHVAKDYAHPYRTLIQRVSLGVDQPLAWGSAVDGSLVPELKFANNTLRFEFAAPSFDLAEANRFQVLLEGRDQAWSPWMSEEFKEYTSLPERTYRFRVRALNVNGHLGQEAALTFRIRPPWYRTWAAYGAYVALLAGLGYAIVRWRIWGLEKEKRFLESKVEQRTEALNRKTHHLETLNAAVKSINECLDYDELLGRILEECRVIPGIEKTTALMRTPGTNQFEYRATSGGSPEALEGITLAGEEAGVRYTGNAQEVARDIFIVRNPGERAAGDKVRQAGTPQAMIVVRVRIGGTVEGYFIFENLTTADAFDANAIELLSGLREPLVSAVQKARILAALHRQTADLGRMNGQLRLLNEQKNQFFGIVAHDLRNPLNGIVLEAELIEDKEELPDIYAAARNIQREGMEMSALIGRFLDIAAIESGKIQAETQIFDLGEVASHVATRHAARAKEKGIELRAEIGGDRCLTFADRKFVKEVVDNLVSNALKFSPSGKSVTIRVENRAGMTRISVEDQGPGLTEEDRRRLFGRFARLSAQPTAGEKSTGLGLSIVKHMVDAMGGRIWVESEPGQGAAFRVELPSATHPHEAAHPLSTPPSSLPGRPLRGFHGHVLLADDNAANRKLEAAILHRLGLEVREAEDGEQVLEILEGGGFDLVFLDGQMPRRDGPATTAEIRLREAPGGPWAGRRQVLVALTGLVDGPGQERFRDSGIDGMLAKPLDPEALHNVLERFLPAGPAAGSRPGDSWKALAEALGGAEAFAEFLAEFLADAEARLSRLHGAMETSDRGQIERDAHDLKSNAAFLGFRLLAEACEGLEHQASVMPLEALQARLMRLQELLEDARTESRRGLKR